MMDPLWSETCWSTFKYFIILIVSTNYMLVHQLDNTVFEGLKMFEYPTSSNLVSLHTYPLMKMEHSVPKRRYIKFRRRGITQKKPYNIERTRFWASCVTNSTASRINVMRVFKYCTMEPFGQWRHSSALS